MTNQILVTTTGTPSVVVIDGLGGLTLTDPVVDFPLVVPEGDHEYSDVIDSLESTEAGSLGLAVSGGEVTLADNNGNPISPGGGQADFVKTTGDESIAGLKTFTNDELRIDAPSGADDLILGYFTDLAPADPNAYGVRRSSGSGYLTFMSNASFPQFVSGDPNGTNQTFFDCTNNGELFLNQLDTGVGNPGLVTVGQGGLTVGSTNAGTPNLTLTSVTGGTFWNVYVGSPGNFDDWLRFSAVGSSAFNEAVLLPDGVWRLRDGVAGSPAHGFIDFSNYGMFMNPSLGGNPALGFSTLGSPRLYLRDTGIINVPAFGAGRVVSDSGGDLSVEPDPERSFNQSLTQQTINFGAGVTAYTTMNNSSITASNTAAEDYEVTANFSARITNNNNRTVQFAIFVNSVETVTFEQTRFDQANDDKSITIRWNLNLAAGATVDWRVRNINASADFQLNRRNFTIEQF